MSFYAQCQHKERNDDNVNNEPADSTLKNQIEYKIECYANVKRVKDI